MKQDELLTRQHKILRNLSLLPRKMISIHGHENMTEFVLHELCGEHCFNFDKAAFIIDNPDFNCLKGITGFSRQEAQKNPDIWQESHQFSSHMKQANFNQKVRNINRSSLKNDAIAEKDIMAQLANDLGLKNHNFCTWDMKHHNNGYLVFEKVNNDDMLCDEYLINGLSLLAHCPIF